MVEEPICFSWPTFAGERHSVTGEAQLLEHFCQLSSLRGLDKAQKAVWGLPVAACDLSRQQLSAGITTPQAPPAAAAPWLCLRMKLLGAEVVLGGQEWWVMCCDKGWVM